MNLYELYDHYNDFMQDYYSSIKWLKILKDENPKLKIGIKHHPSAGFDHFEDRIINGSGIDLIDKDLESYQLVLNCKICITYASTLGYEALILNKPCLFFDPNENNNFISYKGENKVIDKYRVTNFNEFSYKVNLLLNEDLKFTKIEKKSLSDLVVKNQNPIRIIYETLIE